MRINMCILAILLFLFGNFAIASVSVKDAKEILKNYKCYLKLHIVVDDIPEAENDGLNIYVTTGLLYFCRNKAELAVILGHEIGHLSLLQLFRKPHDVELKADYDGFKLAKYYGYEACKGIKIWSRIANEYTDIESPSHPKPSYRYKELLKLCKKH